MDALVRFQEDVKNENFFSRHLEKLMIKIMRYESCFFVTKSNKLISFLKDQAALQVTI